MDNTPILQTTSSFTNLEMKTEKEGREKVHCYLIVILLAQSKKKKKKHFDSDHHCQMVTLSQCFILQIDLKIFNLRNHSSAINL